MKKFNKNSIISLLVMVGMLVAPATTFAATTPSLGMASTFNILAGSYVNTAPGTTIAEDLGYTTGPAVAPTVGGGTHIADGTYNQAGIDQGSALANLNSQPCSFTFAPGAIDLATDTTHGSAGIYTPGVYCTTGSGAATVGTGGITLNGAGTYLFRVNGALTTVANSAVTLSNGATACNVFWTPIAATTLGATSTFAGIDIDASGITIGSTVTWTGQALAFGGTVSTNVDTIAAPTCMAPPTSSGTTTGTGTTPGTSSGSSSSSSSAGGAVPKLPNTGYGPVANHGALWSALLPIIAITVGGSAYFVRKRRAL